MSSFRKFGGLHFSPNNNIVKSYITNAKQTNSNTSYGQKNSKEVFDSHLDINGNSILHTGNIYFQDGTSMSTAGNNGAQGNQGPQGAIGDQGYLGTTGSGFQGDTGAIVVGPIGVQGTTGLQGNTGPTGAQGAQGAQGMTGHRGHIGPTGITGNIGSQGPTGKNGLTGFTGVNGITGVEGLTGTIGTTGIIGPTGRVGTTGAQGSTGAGMNGIPIVYGDTGSTGMTGTVLTGAIIEYGNSITDGDGLRTVTFGKIKNIKSVNASVQTFNGGSTNENICIMLRTITNGGTANFGSFTVKTKDTTSGSAVSVTREFFYSAIGTG